MSEYYILAWLFFYYAVVVLSALVGFWIKSKYRENELANNEKIARIENGIVSQEPNGRKLLIYTKEEENKTEN